MALTLIEAAKLNSGDVIRSAIIELYARSSPVLQVLPFEDITGNALRYNREDKLPGVGFRGVNEAYTEGTGVINPQVETLSIAGGDLDVDTFITRTMGPDQRSTQEAMKVKALALRWTKAFFKGDSSSDPREFDGLQGRITGTMLVDNGHAGLSLGALDEAIDNVQNPTHIFMNKTMARKLSAAARDRTIAGEIEFTKDEFGYRLMTYAGLPIMRIDEDEQAQQILPFTEEGTADSTSIYVTSLMPGMLTGIQNGTIDARDLGELETKPAFRTRVEWYAGLACFHGKAAARVHNVTNAAVTA